jgi:hypothetical protein
MKVNNRTTTINALFLSRYQAVHGGRVRAAGVQDGDDVRLHGLLWDADRELGLRLLLLLALEWDLLLAFLLGIFRRRSRVGIAP